METLTIEHLNKSETFRINAGRYFSFVVISKDINQVQLWHQLHIIELE